ncbi:threonine--tRNA ligase [Candidatus Berkelbacteria bacterium CG23_combo_of_CG06-09_8_20_14_all_33_15]|nr:MAG: threonine--tRNA ligase [Candidatus Berkelbacteria bacterium CG23_combo_of_CG06-09_8_20_14_all_33_15]
MQNINIEKIRHSLAHILAESVIDLYPEVEVAIGPVVENGFYYDIDFKNENISVEDLQKIETKMVEIIQKKRKFIKKRISQGEAKKIFSKNRYKLELIKEIEEKKLTIYRSEGGNFIDLCKGPHIADTDEIDVKSFKLTKLAGAYWRGSENNKMLTRIYGVAFETPDELKIYLENQEKLSGLDHKTIGQQMDLFFFDPTAPGMAYWTDKGLKIINQLIEYWRNTHEALGYKEYRTPLINKKELYVKSGHWDHYNQHMFIANTKEKEIYGLKPMNCPNAMIVYKHKIRSYKDLPLKISDTDTLHRLEKSGTLNGLLRVREFSQDDAHIFISCDNIESQYLELIGLVEKFYKLFDIDYSFRLGTRPDKFIGNKEDWKKSENILVKVLKKSGKNYDILVGDGAFYGPKIDILMNDNYGRSWQTGTLQLDFQIPKNFDLKYTDKDGLEKTPVVIHRVIYGSLERFIGILLEHTKGELPIWISPVQIRLLPISEKFINETEVILSQLKENNIRAEIDNRNLTLSKKIKFSQNEKIPYMAVIGRREIDSLTMTVRKYNEKELKSVSINDFVKIIKKATP